MTCTDKKNKKTEKKMFTNTNLMYIIKNARVLGISELVQGDCIIRFNGTNSDIKQKPNTQGQQTLSKESQTLKKSGPRKLKDEKLSIATYGMDNPSEFMESLEKGEMEFAKVNDFPTGEKI